MAGLTKGLIAADEKEPALVVGLLGSSTSSTVYASIGTTDYSDYFSLYCDGSKDYCFIATASAGEPDLAVYDRKGYLMVYTDYEGGYPTDTDPLNTDIIWFDPPKSGTYYLDVGANVSGAYIGTVAVGAYWLTNGSLAT